MSKKIDSILEVVRKNMFFSYSKKVFVVLFMSASGTIFAQQVIEGTVTSRSNGKPLSNVTVTVANTNQTVTSDEKGHYKITANPDDVLVFTYNDYDSKEVKVGKDHKVNVQLKNNTLAIDEVVLIGYGKQKKSDLTGSVAAVNVTDAKKTITYDAAKMLQGQVPGVTVQSSGEPGSFVNIKIRGISSFNNNNPLFVVDGVIVNNPYDFSPSDIESISVLKDASSAAIYGVQGANGVVIIQTKQGKKGKLNLTYRVLNGYQSAPKSLSVTNREQYQQITNQAYLNSGQAILPANDPSNPNFISNVDTDWQKEGFRTGTLQNHTINMNGGTEDINYAVNLDYFKNTSYMNTPQDYERYSMNMNFGGKKGKFSYGGKISYTQSDKENFNAYDNGSPLIYLLQAIPTMPVYDPNRLGGYGGTDRNTQAAISLNIIGYNHLITNTAKRHRFMGSVWGEYEILKNLKYKLNVSFDRLNINSRVFVPVSDLGWYYVTEPGEAQLDVSSNHLTTTFINNLLTYDIKLGEHKLDFLAGWIQEKNDYYNQWSRGVGYSAGSIAQIEYADSRDGGEYNNTYTAISYISRLNYNYKEKYFLTANFRQDKSSKFAPRNNHGEYFSFSGGWRLDREEFLKLPDYVNLLKLRGGWGRLGNNTIGVYAWENTVNPFASYIFGNAIHSGTTVVPIKDPNIKWETTETTNVAFEIGLFNKLNFVAEYYEKKSYDILASVPLPYSSGGFPNSILTNAASVKNNGFDFLLSYSNNDKDFKYTVSANLSTLNNKVLNVGSDNNPIYGINSKTDVGRSAGELYGWIAEGIFQNTADIQNHATQVNAQPGDIKFKDLNGDGQITDADRTYLGRTIPKFTYGLNFSGSYKNFDFSMFWQGSAGNYIYNGTYSALMVGQLVNHSTDMLNYWTPTNTNTNIPRPVMSDPNANNRASNRFVEKGDYLKLQSLEVGYNIPIKSDYLKKIRIFASGQNIWTITGYKGYDPDFISDGLFSRGFEYGSFPNPRTISFGLEANF